MSYRITTGWHRGPPPSIGWWPASVSNDVTCLRWWDGHNWGQAVYRGARIAAIDSAAACKVHKERDGIYWRHRPASWPARSRT